MGDIQVESSNIFKADSGGITFKVKCHENDVFATLYSKEFPRKPLIKVTIGHVCRIICLVGDERKAQTTSHGLLTENEDSYVHLWLTWYCGWVQFGRVGDKEAILTCRFDILRDYGLIGFVHMTTASVRPDTWIMDSEIPPERPLAPKKQISSGKLRWAPVTDPLPKDALIGGMESKPTYIARAHHNGSLVPGKFLPWLNLCFVPWGHSEHVKETHECEILCGYDVEWVWTTDDQVPENAVVGGYSELRHEPLYVGRGPCGGQMIPGKVHVHYKTCYIPYMSQEHELRRYQILVATDKESRGILATA